MQSSLGDQQPRRVAGFAAHAGADRWREGVNETSARMSVLVGNRFACIKISGRANFTSSIDFKNVLTELYQEGFRYFVLELSECILMDSTFLGVLAGAGLKLS